MRATRRRGGHWFDGIGTWAGMLRRGADRLLFPDPFATNFDAVVVLNLARAPERRAAMVRTFRATGVGQYRFLDAVDGQQLDLAAMVAAGDLVPKPDGSTLTPGEAGCLLSHRMAWQLMLDEGIERMLICEDDIHFRVGARWWLRKHMARMPRDWDIIHFWSSVRVGSGKSWDAGREEVAPGILRGNREGGGTVCYAVSRAAAVYLLEISWPLCHRADGVTAWVTAPWQGGGLERGLKGYVAWPFICRPDNRTTYIGERSPGG
jgi:glycosyl transferase family 25